MNGCQIIFLFALAIGAGVGVGSLAQWIIGRGETFNTKKQENEL